MGSKRQTDDLEEVSTEGNWEGATGEKKSLNKYQ